MWCIPLFNVPARFAVFAAGAAVLGGLFAGCVRESSAPVAETGAAQDRADVVAVPADPAVGEVFAVGPQEHSSSFGIYNTSPESPDGSRIAYVRFTQEPEDPKDGRPGELWVCDTDLTHHRKVRNMGPVRPHNGSQVFWGNDHTLIYQTPYDAEPPCELHVVDAETGEDRFAPIPGALAVSHDVHEQKILFATDKRADGTAWRPAGIYELDLRTGEIRSILTLEALNALKPSIPSAALDAKGLYPDEGWHFFHLMYSPEGSHIAFRLDIGKQTASRLRVVMTSDGQQVYFLDNPLLHFCFYDDDTMAGHDRRPGHELLPVRYTVDGTFIETLAEIPGNHFAISPDRQGFASETDYGSDPVVLHYYHAGDSEPRLTLATFSPQDVVWEKRFHVNPAFSRDGKRLYFHMPTADGRNGTYVAIVEP